MNNLKLKVTKKDSPKGAPTEAPNGEAVTDKTSHLAPKTKKRTRGLWLFDAALYFFSNAVVFAISVVATYFTEQGGVRRAPDGTLLKPTAENPLTKKDGELVYGRFANWMSLRGTNLDNVLINDLKMSREGAEMTRMVFFLIFRRHIGRPSC